MNYKDMSNRTLASIYKLNYDLIQGYKKQGLTLVNKIEIRQLTIENDKICSIIHENHENKEVFELKSLLYG